MGCPEAEVGESMLPSSEGFLAEDLGPDVNLQGMRIFWLKISVLTTCVLCEDCDQDQNQIENQHNNCT